jgi:alpha-2-macroglobulin
MRQQTRSRAGIPGAGKALALATGVAALSVVGVRASQVGPQTLADADKQFDHKSYKNALKAYEAAQVPADRRDVVAYRIAVSLGKTQQWDRALTAGLEFVKTHRGSVLEARGLYWLGRLYVSVPHQGYRVGSRTFRGQNVPKASGDDKPVLVILTDRDQRNTRDALEAARITYPVSATTYEQIQLDYDLIHVLERDSAFAEWAQKHAWLPPGDDSWHVDAAQPYEVTWLLPKKIVYLYRHIGRLAKGDSRQRALALFSEALWVRQYQAVMGRYAVKVERNQAIKIPYPYQDIRPGAMLGDLIRQFPNELLRNQAEYARAAWMAQDGQVPGALVALRQLIAARPQSSWARDARAQIDALTRPDASVWFVGPSRPGSRARVQLTYRNVRQVHLDAYRIDLPRLLTRPESIHKDQSRSPDWNDLSGLLGGLTPQRTLDRALASRGAHRVASWNQSVNDRRDYQAHGETIVTPLQEAGAYIIVASVPGQRNAALLPITDLMLIQKTQRGGGLYYVADAQSGRPQANARVIVKQWWEKGDKRGAIVSQGLTNRDGLVTIPISSGQGRSINNIGAVAILGTRFALVNPSYFQQYGEDGEQGRVKAYSTTDRTVYRPQQVVQFRHLLMARMQAASGRGSLRLGEFHPLANRLVRVVVTDPQGNVVYKQRSRCTEFGSVSGQFTLPPHAPLGEYGMDVSLPVEIQDTRHKAQGSSQEAEQEEAVDAAGNRFRVEEYKKPEFEVTVTPSAARVKLGQPTQAKIHAAYYFGGPVPNARATYRVYRSQYAASYRFPQPFDYLYNNDANQGDYDTNYRSGEVIAQGKTNLDAQGDATVTFGTKADGARWQSSDLSYTVEADIQDQSRRVISGTGALKATRHDVAVFLNFAHGYATQGDRVDVEVKTLNPSDQPVSVEGTARVYRLPDNPNSKETPVASFPLQTDAQGHGEIQWKAEKAGYFRIAFETRDTDGEKVSGDTNIWVDGAELRARRFLFQGVTLAVKNPYYQAGETARVLLVTPAPGCTVLLTREAEGQILDKRVIRVPGRSLEVTVPVTRRDAPNVFLSAVMARNGETFEASQELFVPPVRQTARVTLQADKPRYAPGEKAHLILQARDFLGRPLRAELSVAISDQALNYIQKDYAPDIRAYFYGDRRAQSVPMQGSQQVSFNFLTETTTPLQYYPTSHFTLPDMGQISFQEFQTQYGRGGRFRDMAGYDTGRLVNGVDFALVSDSNINMSSVTAGGKVLNGHGRLIAGANAGVGRDAFYMQFKTDIGGGGRGGEIGSSSNSIRGTLAPMGESTSGGIPVGTATRTAKELYALARALPSLRHPRQAGELADAVIRSDFRDTAFWTPAVVTNAQGQATVDVTWPDNLTQWRARAVGSTTTAQVGTGETRVTTKKDLLVQLEAPRFLVERDVATFSAIVHNDTDHESRIRVKLDLDNADVTGIDLASLTSGTANAQTRAVAYTPTQNPKSKPQNPDRNPNRLLVKTSETWITVARGGQQRVDWLVRPQHEGIMHARMTAQSQTDGDAAQTILPVLTHGVEREVVQTGVLRVQNEKTGIVGRTGKTAEQAQVTITLPALRKSGSSRLVVTLNPSLAGVMLDALPYLADYPYGCVEQTMSRFLPGVIVANTLRSGGYNLRDLEKAARQHGLASQTSQQGQPNKQPRTMENSAYTYPNARQGAQHQEINVSDERWRSPVFHSAELNRMVRDGLARLKDFQHDDGGWGWWKDDPSDSYMSTYVVYGLLACQRAGIAVPDNELARGLQFLPKRYLAETDLHQMAYQARVLALVPALRPAIEKRVNIRLYPQREKLSAYGKALLALALHDLGQNEHAKIVLDNLENTAHVDEANGTANWDDVDSDWWRWYNNKVETNATILQAYIAIAPNAKMPSLLVKWLVNNRRGVSWHDTLDTSLAVNALADWMRVHKELSPNYTLTLDLGGRVRRSYRVTPANALFFDNTFVVPDSLLQTGDQTLTLTRQGTGACYFTATTRTFSEEEPIKATGSEIQVRRRYFRLIPGTASSTQEIRESTEGIRKEGAIQNPENPFLTGKYELVEQGGEQQVGEETEQGPKYERVELRPDDIVNSGDLLEVELDLEAKNDYEYVLFEDMKPAGCEPVEVRSGDHSGQGVYSNMELRDEKVAFFLSRLPQGHRILSYRLRVETPGLFHALPTNGYAMYAPDVRTLSDENRLSIHEETSSGGE